MNKNPPRKGDRYVVLKEFEAIVQTQWFAPFSGGDYRLLPAGLEFVVTADPPPVATAVGCKPEPFERWEAVLVEESDRTDELYGGYSVVIPFKYLATHCARQ